MYQYILLVAVVSSTAAFPRSPRIYNVLISSKKNLAPSQALPVYEPVLRTASVGYSFTPFVYTHLSSFPASHSYAQQDVISPDVIREPADGQIYVQREVNEQENRYAKQAAVVDNVPGQFQNVQVEPDNSRQSNVYGTQAADTSNVPDQFQNVPANHESQRQPNVFPETAANTKSLPSNVVPLEQYVPYYGPITLPQYLPDLPRIQPQQPVVVEKTREENDPKHIVANFKRNPDIPDVPPPPLPVKSS